MRAESMTQMGMEPEKYYSFWPNEHLNCSTTFPFTRHFDEVFFSSFGDYRKVLVEFFKTEFRANCRFKPKVAIPLKQLVLKSLNESLRAKTFNDDWTEFFFYFILTMETILSTAFFTQLQTPLNLYFRAFVYHLNLF